MSKKVLILPAYEKGHFNGLMDEVKYLRQSLLYKQILPRTPSRLKTSMISVNNVILSISSSCPSCASWLQNPFNQRNLCPRYPRLINDLRLRKITYEKINLFLQNEPNFRKSQVNITDLLKRDYEKWTLGQLGKTNPKRTQTNPKRTQFWPIKRQYEPNSNPIQTQFILSLPPAKLEQTQFLPAINIAGQIQKNVCGCPKNIDNSKYGC